MKIPIVTAAHALEFFRTADNGSPWTYDGVAILGLDKPSVQFTVDFTNAIIRQLFKNFIEEEKRKQLVVAGS